MAAVAIETGGQISQDTEECFFDFFGSFLPSLVPANHRDYETVTESKKSHVGEHR